MSDTYNDEQVIYNPANIVHSIVLPRWSNMVNRILSVIEMALSEGRQYNRVKKSLNTVIYRYRESVLVQFSRNEEYSNEFMGKFLHSQFDAMHDGVRNILTITFEEKERRDIIEQAIGEIEKEVLSDIILTLEESY